MIIAIDGPAGSGKSSTARALARSLGGFYLDTGAMYRAMAVAFRRADAPPTEEAAAGAIGEVEIDLFPEEDSLRVVLDGEDVTAEIRHTEITSLSSLVSQLPSVRERLVREQRRLAGRYSDRGLAVVVEGRDIGTVVFPQADVKFFMVADPEIRAHRRLKDLKHAGQRAELGEVLDDLRRRDRQDSERDHSPLRRADDAVLVDTSRLTPPQQVELMLEVIHDRATTRDGLSSSNTNNRTQSGT